MCVCGTVAGLSVTHTIIALLRVYSQCLHEHSAYVVGERVITIYPVGIPFVSTMRFWSSYASRSRSKLTKIHTHTHIYIYTHTVYIYSYSCIYLQDRALTFVVYVFCSEMMTFVPLLGWVSGMQTSFMNLFAFQPDGATWRFVTAVCVWNFWHPKTWWFILDVSIKFLIFAPKNPPIIPRWRRRKRQQNRHTHISSIAASVGQLELLWGDVPGMTDGHVEFRCGKHDWCMSGCDWVRAWLGYRWKHAHFWLVDVVINHGGSS